MAEENDFLDPSWVDILAFDDAWVDYPEAVDSGDDGDGNNDHFFKKWKRVNNDDLNFSVSTSGPD